MSSGSTLTAKLVKSPIGFPLRQKRTVRSLGFTHLQQEKTLPDNEAVRGMIQAVGHLVKIVDPAVERTGKKRNDR